MSKTKQHDKKSPLRVYVYFRTKQEVERIDRAAKKARRSRSEFIAENILRTVDSSQVEAK